MVTMTTMTMIMTMVSTIMMTIVAAHCFLERILAPPLVRFKLLYFLIAIFSDSQTTS